MGKRLFATRLILFNSKGSILFLTLMMTSFLSVLVLLATEIFTLSIQATQNFENSLQLFYVAEAGLAHGQAFCRIDGCDEVFNSGDGEGGPEGESGEAVAFYPYYEWIAYDKGEYFLEAYMLSLGEDQPYLEKDSGVLIVATAALRGRENTKTLCLLLEEGPSWRPVAWWEPQ